MLFCQSSIKSMVMWPSLLIYSTTLCDIINPENISTMFYFKYRNFPAIITSNFQLNYDFVNWSICYKVIVRSNRKWFFFSYKLATKQPKNIKLELNRKCNLLSIAHNIRFSFSIHFTLLNNRKTVSMSSSRFLQ